MTVSCPGLEGVSDPSCRGTSCPSVGAFVCLAGGVGKPEEVPVDDPCGLVSCWRSWIIMMYWSSGKNSTGVLHCVLEFEVGDVTT